VVRRQRDRSREPRDRVPHQGHLEGVPQQDRQVRGQQRHRQERGDRDPRHQL
jgi:hypothetical protein